MDWVKLSCPPGRCRPTTNFSQRSREMVSPFLLRPEMVVPVQTVMVTLAAQYKSKTRLAIPTLLRWAGHRSRSMGPVLSRTKSYGLTAAAEGKALRFRVPTGKVQPVFPARDGWYRMSH